MRSLCAATWSRSRMRTSTGSSSAASAGETASRTAAKDFMASAYYAVAPGRRPFGATPHRATIEAHMLIRVHPQDNVAIVVDPEGATLQAGERIPQSHKAALRAIGRGE